MEKRWVWKRYGGGGWLSWWSKQTATTPASPSPSRPERGSLRDCGTEGCGSPRQPRIMELKEWIINLTVVVSFDYHLILYLIRVFPGCQEIILMEPECIN